MTRPAYVYGVAALAAAAAAASITVGLTWGGRRISVAPDSLAVFDPATNRLVGDVQLHSVPSSVAVGGGSIWVTSSEDRTLFRIDARQKTIVKTIALPGPPGRVAFGDGAVWLTYLVRAQSGGDPFAGDGAVLRIDPQHGYLQRSIETGEGFSNEYNDAIAANRRGVWVFDPPGVVTRIDPASSAVAGKWHLPPATAFGVAVGNGPAWVLTGAGVARIGPRRDSTPTTISLAAAKNASSPAAQAIVVGDGSVWTANFPQGVGDNRPGAGERGPGDIFRIDPTTNLVDDTISGGFRRPIAAAYGEGALWVIDDRSLFRVDPAKNRVADRSALAHEPVGVAAGDGHVWVAVGGTQG